MRILNALRHIDIDLAKRPERQEDITFEEIWEILRSYVKEIVCLIAQEFPLGLWLRDWTVLELAV